MKNTVKAVVLASAVAATTALNASSAQAQFPGSNGRIAFVRGGDIYTASSTGTDVKRLTTTAAVEGAPRWSPDGTRIAYTRGDAVWTMTATGAQQVRRFVGRAPAWSPDGQRLAYLGKTEGFKDVDGTIVCRYDEVFHRPWTGGTGAPVEVDGYNAAAGCSFGQQYRHYGSSLVWKADGTRVLFSYQLENGEANNPADYYSYGVSERAVKDAPESNKLPTWPDDTARTPEVDYAPSRDNILVATNAGDPGKVGRLWAYSRDGSYKKQASPDGNVRWPVGSPDGKYALYTQSNPGQRPSLRRVTLPVSTPVTVLTNASQPDWQRK